MTDIVPITPQNFEEHKKRILKVIQELNLEDLDPNFEMSLQQGIQSGNHASECDACNILHYMMSFVINNHRLQVGK